MAQSPTAVEGLVFGVSTGAQEPLQLLGVKPDYHLVFDYDGGGGAAVKFLDQLDERRPVPRDVFLFELNLMGRKKLLRHGAGGSAGLRIDHHAPRGHPFSFLSLRAGLCFLWLPLSQRS